NDLAHCEPAADAAPVCRQDDRGGREREGQAANRRDAKRKQVEKERDDDQPRVGFALAVRDGDQHGRQIDDERDQRDREAVDELYREQLDSSAEIRQGGWSEAWV